MKVSLFVFRVPTECHCGMKCKVHSDRVAEPREDGDLKRELYVGSLFFLHLVKTRNDPAICQDDRVQY